MKRNYFVLFVVMLAAVSACSGDKNITLEQKLLDDSQVEYVTFSIAGNATCGECSDDEIPIDAMQIELYPKQGALDSLSMKIYDGLGAFSMQNIKGVKGQILQIQGKLLREGTNGYVTAYYGYAEIVVPGEDGEVVGVSLKFPSTDSD